VDRRQPNLLLLLIVVLILFLIIILILIFIFVLSSPDLRITLARCPLPGMSPTDLQVSIQLVLRW
jgi:hypothetical protein